MATNSIHDAFISALMADATYVEDLVPFGVPRSGDDLINQLKSRLTPELAKYFAAHFDVVQQYLTDDHSLTSTGFDVTLSRNCRLLHWSFGLRCALDRAIGHHRLRRPVVFWSCTNRRGRLRAHGHGWWQGKHEAGAVQAISRYLGNLKRSPSGRYHAFDFAKCMCPLLHAFCLSTTTSAPVIRVAEVGR